MSGNQRGPVTHAVVLAGGLGTRITSVLGDQPKALATVADRPFLDWKLDELQRNQISHATFLLGHGSQEIISFLEKNNRDLEIDSIIDGPELLGTGGALANALGRLPERFFLTYGDNLLDMPYRELTFAAATATTSCALAVTSKIGPADQPNAVVRQRRVETYSKTYNSFMTFMDYGVMLLAHNQTSEAIQGLHPPFDLAAVLTALADNSDLAAAVTDLPYWEIGTPQTLERTDIAMRERAAKA